MFAYEWDERKRQQTLRERGLDFADARRMDPERTETRKDLRGDYGETRYISIGPIDGRLHVMVWTWRGSAVRIISLRKANEGEEKSHGRKIVHR